MMTLFFHSICYILWIIILAAIAVVAVSIAYIVVRVIFLDSKNDDSTGNSNR